LRSSASSSFIGTFLVYALRGKAKNIERSPKNQVGGTAMDDYQEELLESHAAEPDIAQWDEDATEL
jgi:hypothetical protein